jgi:hypothetical protein
LAFGEAGLDGGAELAAGGAEEAALFGFAVANDGEGANLGEGRGVRS